MFWRKKREIGGNSPYKVITDQALIAKTRYRLTICGFRDFAPERRKAPLRRTTGSGAENGATYRFAIFGFPPTRE
jgi:hypothetical protein